MGDKQCTANVTYGANCDQHLGTFRGSGTGDSVATLPLELIDSVTEYCYLVTTSSGAVTVNIDGTLNVLTTSTSGNHYLFGFDVVVKIYFLLQAYQVTSL